MINDRTNRDYPLPHPENIAKHDVVRMREAFVAVDADIENVETICVQLKKDRDREIFEEFIGFSINK